MRAVWAVLFTSQTYSVWIWVCSTRRRDYTRVVNGRNPIVAHEFLGTNVEGKDMLIIDDMISSGESMTRGCHRTERAEKPARIFICATFGLFTNGTGEIRQGL